MSQSTTFTFSVCAEQVAQFPPYTVYIKNPEGENEQASLVFALAKEKKNSQMHSYCSFQYG